MGARSLRSSVVVSVALNLFFLMACAILTLQRPAVAPRRTTWIELDPSKIPEVPKKKTQDEIRKRQLVQTEKGHIVEKALPDSFLGEHNQVVDRQTVSHKRETVM